MGLSNYTDLQATIADWLNRADLASQIPDFITLFESQAQRVLRTRQMVKRSTANCSSQFFPLPSDYLSLVNMQVNVQPVRVLQYVTPGEADAIRAANATGVPEAYTIVGSNLEFAPAPDTTYEVEIIYYAALPKLSASVASNWLLSQHPDAYLYGSLLQAAPYLKDDDRVTGWDAALSSILETIRVEDERSTFSGVPLKMRITPYG